MQIRRATDYAVRVMIHFASLPEGTRVPLQALAQAGGTPVSFVSKVLQRLVQCGMVTSLRGAGGGFQLAVDPEEVTVLGVVEAVEGPLQINWCLPGKKTCDRKDWCGAHPIWTDAQAALRQVLASASIARLARDTLANLAAEQQRAEFATLKASETSPS